MMEARLPEIHRDLSEDTITEMTISSVASGNAAAGISHLPYNKPGNVFGESNSFVERCLYTSPPYDYADSPERNINERWASSVESSNPGSVVSPNKPIQQTETTFKDDLFQTQLYRRSLQMSFKKIKDNIDIVSMTEKAVDADLVRKEDVSWINSKRRSKKADLLVTKIIQTIELKNIKKFEEIIGKSIAEQIFKCRSMCSTRQEFGTTLCNSKLQRSRSVLISSLQPDDIEEMKDFFIDNFIIDIYENEDILRHPGFVMPRSEDFVSFFVDDYIIGKESIGSFQCLVQFLRKTSNMRIRHILSVLEVESNVNIDNAELVPKSIKTFSVEQEDYDVKKTQIESQNVKISIAFQDKDQQTDKVCKRMISKVKAKNGIFASVFGGIIKDSKEGSVIIYLTSLHKYTLQRIINSISHGQFSKVLELLFKDDEIKRILTPGNYKLEMDVRVCDDVPKMHERPERKTNLTQNIADNRSFLVEEIDTLQVLEKFRNQGIDIESDIEEKDRKYRAGYLINIAIDNMEAAKTLFSTLKDMPHVQERLTTYERVYKTDPIRVCKHILNNFLKISETVDLADIRIVFVERGIFENKQLDDIENEFGKERTDVMAVFLAEVMQNGNDAMLTLVDALFLLELDDLAESLIIEFIDVFEEFPVTEESTTPVVKIKGSGVREDSVASATFVLNIAKGAVKRQQDPPAIDDSISVESTKRLRPFPVSSPLPLRIDKKRPVKRQQTSPALIKSISIKSTKRLRQFPVSSPLPLRIDKERPVKRQQDPPAIDDSIPVESTKCLRIFPVSPPLPLCIDKEHNIASGAVHDFEIEKNAMAVSFSQYNNGQYRIPEPDAFRLYPDGVHHHAHGIPSYSVTRSINHAEGMQATGLNTNPYGIFKFSNTNGINYESCKRNSNPTWSPFIGSTYPIVPLQYTSHRNVGVYGNMISETNRAVPPVQSAFPGLSLQTKQPASFIRSKLQIPSVLEDGCYNRRFNDSCSSESETSRESTSYVFQSAFSESSQKTSQPNTSQMSEGLLSEILKVPKGFEDVWYNQRFTAYTLPASEQPREVSSSFLPFQYISSDDDSQDETMIYETPYRDKSSFLDGTQTKTQPKNFKMGEGLLTAICRIQSAISTEYSQRNLNELQSTSSGASSMCSSPELVPRSNIIIDDFEGKNNIAKEKAQTSSFDQFYQSEINNYDSLTNRLCSPRMLLFDSRKTNSIRLMQEDYLS